MWLFLLADGWACFIWSFIWRCLASAMRTGLQLLLSCQSRPLVPEHGSQSVRNERWFLSSGIIHTNVSQLSQEKQFQLEQCTIHFPLAEKKGKGTCYYSDFYIFFASAQTLRWCVERWNLKIEIREDKSKSSGVVTLRLHGNCLQPPLPDGANQVS